MVIEFTPVHGGCARIHVGGIAGFRIEEMHAVWQVGRLQYNTIDSVGDAKESESTKQRGDERLPCWVLNNLRDLDLAVAMSLPLTPTALDASLDASLEAHLGKDTEIDLNDTSIRPNFAMNPDTFLTDMDDIPLFMQHLPENHQDNIAIQALQSLVYDGTPQGILWVCIILFIF